MKKLIMMILVVLVSGLTTQTLAQKKENKVVCFKSNMNCDKCETKLNDYLKFEKGVKDLKVDHVSNTIMIEFKDGKNSDEKLAKAIEKKGFEANKISKEKYDEILKESKKE